MLRIETAKVFQPPMAPSRYKKLIARTVLQAETRRDFTGADARALEAAHRKLS